MPGATIKYSLLVIAATLLIFWIVPWHAESRRAATAPPAAPGKDSAGAPMPAPPPARSEALIGDNVLRCGDKSFRSQHEACFVRELANVPSEQRQSVGQRLAKFRQILAEEDKLDRDGDDNLAKMIRDLNALRASPLTSPAELTTYVRRFCVFGHGDPKIGMTEIEAMATSWCYPTSVTETITAGHTSRQYVYRREFLGYPWGNGHEGYLYFDDGRLVTIQR
jgi:hypothetical protein